MATAARLVLDPFLGNDLPYITFLVAVALVGYYGGPGATFLALVSGGLAANWLFIPPRHTLVLADTSQQIGFAVYCTASMAFVWISYGWQHSRERREMELVQWKRAEQALSASKDRFRFACAAAGLGVFDYDVERDRCLWENDRMYEIFGRAREKGPLSRSEFLRDYVYPDDVPILEQALHDRYPGGAFRPLIRFRRPDGIIRWLQYAAVFEKGESSGALRLVGVIADVTEQQTAKVEISDLNRRLEERVTELQALFSLAPVGIFVAQDAECRTIKANPAAARFVNDTSHKKFSMIDPEKNRPAFQVLQNGKMLPTELPMHYAATHRVELRNQEIEVLYRDGRRIILDASATPLLDETGSVRGCIGIFMDMTARKKAEDDLRQLAKDLEHRVLERTSELMESQARLRELATELNLTEQRERKRLATELHDYLAQMLVLARLKLGQVKQTAGLASPSVDLIDQAEKVLHDSLTYTRTLVADLCPPVLQEFGLPAALTWLSERMKRLDLRVTIEVGEEKCRLPEDHAVLVFQSVRELLMNVVKHAGVKEACVCLHWLSECLIVEVRDKGRGFQPSDGLRKNARQSESFGLFSIRERMRAVGGSFELESSLESGTTARLTLPVDGGAGTATSGIGHGSNGNAAVDCCEEPSAAGPEASYPNTSPIISQASHIARVLLVDDHAMMRQGLCSILENYADIDVVGEASNGEEALAAVERLRPSVVVMDINMPKLNGVEATARIKRRHPEILVIGLSVNAEVNSQAAMIAAGAVVLLTKEAAVEQLYSAILKAVRAETF